jgi:hypothetical protein
LPVYPFFHRLDSLPAQDEFKYTHPAWQIAFADTEEPGKCQPIPGKPVLSGEAIVGQAISNLQGFLKTPAGGTKLDQEFA